MEVGPRMDVALQGFWGSKFEKGIFGHKGIQQEHPIKLTSLPAGHVPVT